MENIPLIIDFVNSQLQFHTGKLNEFRDKNPARADRHSKTAAGFREVLDAITAMWQDNSKLEDRISEMRREIESLKSSHLAGSQASSKRKPCQLSLTLEDITDLPEELLKELSFSDGDKMDFTLQAIINQNGGVMSLDQILVALYRQTGAIHKRQLLNARLYRMVTRGVLFSFPGKKGVYSTQELSQQDAAALSQSQDDSDEEEAQK